ncbi:hypothetical protein C8P64_1608 [Christiangramia gaetbulicola]|uniref:Methyltransferase domain-containing protein n=1 Tax=Christiangramia gaetbulicola TaxID=703340 RepID=A0A2T6AH27_9FLAO|nr:methyltransferase domain-containing protein [Christiangramia gaetbulicola]PTX43082.1 hypothetical protein C8P64_1608 [Christiangramia gaetbulicola]
MSKIDTSKRTDESEIMDDFDLQGEELGKTLNDLDNINAWLGGNQITINGIKKLLEGTTEQSTIKIADIGCGNGAMLRKLAKWGKRNKYNLELTGIDANTHAIKLGEDLSSDYSEIGFKVLNIFSDDFKAMEFDIILCTLTLHHFKDEQIIDLLRQLYDQSNLGIVINDLHRSSAAYILFKAFCAVFVNNEIARKDGLVSILRGFKKEDIIKYKDQLPGEKHFINWKWAFRYQWIIEKEKDNL